MKKQMKDTIVISAALFAMFFGAGNLIFPPAIGIEGGSRWLLSLLGFLVTGIGLPVLGVLAVSKAGGTIDNLADVVGRKFSIIFGSTVIMAIGPLLAIPRTGATVYEIGIQPLVAMHPLVASIIYFSITLFFVIKPSGIVDKVGKILTPILLMVIGLIIFTGLVKPMGIPQLTTIANPFSEGFLQGYQTMDTLASIVLGGIILTALLEKGYTDRKVQMKMTMVSGLIAGLVLALVYGGLLYLGATIGGSVPADITKTALIITITNTLLGQSGQLIMCVAVSAACLTTSIGLTAIVGNYFEAVTKGKLSYRAIVIFTCAFSAIMSVIGVESLVKVADPLLVMVYPIAIILIIFNLADKFIPNAMFYKGGVLGAAIVGALDAINMINFPVVNMAQFLSPLYRLMDLMPLADQGFAWILPSFLFALIGGFIGSNIKGEAKVTKTELA